MTDATAVYLYAVARGLDLAALGGTTGVAGTAVRGIDVGDLTALVSTVPMDQYGEKALRAGLEDLTWLEATARAHHDVVDRAAHAAPTAPVRIATVYRDDGRVAEILTQEGERFRQVLEQITGRTEWGVKAYAYRDAEADEAEAAAEPVAAGGTAAGAGTAYLQRRRRQRRSREDAGRRAAERAQAVHDELRGHAIASRRHPAQDPALSGHDGTLILNVAYLVENDRAEDFLALVRDADGREPGIGVEVTGPWPPYSFIDTETGEG